MNRDSMSAQPIGIDAALSRIQQIQDLQPQLLTGPAPSSGSSAAPGAAAPTTQTTTFAGALAAAQGPATGTAGLGATGLGTATALGTGASTGLTGLTAGATPNVLTALASLNGTTTPAAVQAMTAQADALVGKPYVWGGGHHDFGPQAGYDCSGFVSAVLHAGGYLSAPQDTQTLPSDPGIEAGPGRYVTIYDRTDAGGADHVIIDIGGQFYESGGETGAWGGGGGVAKIGTPDPGYLSSFNQVLHPAGL